MRNQSGHSNTDDTNLEALLRRTYKRREWTEDELLDMAYDPSHLDGEDLFDYWEGTMTDPAKRRELERHAASCEYCFEQYADTGHLVLGPAQQASFFERVLQRIGSSRVGSWLAPLISKPKPTAIPVPEMALGELVLAAAPESASAFAVLGPVASKVRPGFAFRWVALALEGSYLLELYNAENPDVPVFTHELPAQPEGTVMSLETNRPELSDLMQKLVVGESYLWSVRVLDELGTALAYSGILSFEMAQTGSFSEGPDAAVEEAIQSANSLAKQGFVYEAIEDLRQIQEKQPRKSVAETAIAIINDVLKALPEEPKNDDKPHLVRALEAWRRNRE